jgi:hypothetical protein
MSSEWSVSSAVVGVAVGHLHGAVQSEAGCEGISSRQSQSGHGSTGTDGDNVVSGGDGAAMRVHQPRRETPLQREHRLARQREYNNRRRRKATPATAIDERDNGELDGLPRESSVISLRLGESTSLVESEEHYKARLARQRDYNRRRRRGSVPNASDDHDHASGVESTDHREVRLASQREYRKRQRRHETPSQRE